ncbi:MAG: hypothetical protein RR336_04270 [Oscillospiraceae bacterium]
MKSAGSAICDALHNFKIRGNLIPDGWYGTILTESEKPNFLAISILAEILYWYRPKVVSDRTDPSVRLEKKFRADILQKTYAEFAEKFHVPKSSVKKAFSDLQRLGVITCEFRNIMATGIICSNVMFVRLNLTRLAELTGLSSNFFMVTDEKNGVSQEKYNTPSVKGDEVTKKNSTMHHQISGEVTKKMFDTYTETTAKTLTEVSAKVSSSQKEDDDDLRIDALLEYERTGQIPDDYISDPHRLQAILGVICDLPPDHYHSDLQLEAYKYAVAALFSMAEKPAFKIGNDTEITRTALVGKINACLAVDGSICDYLDTVVYAYADAAKRQTISVPDAYMKKVIWEKMDTYRSALLAELEQE